MLLLKLYPGVVLKKTKQGLKPIHCSRSLQDFFAQADKLSDVCRNITDQDLTQFTGPKQLCLLSGQDGHLLTAYQVLCQQFFGFRFIVTFSDLSPILNNLVYSSNPLVLTDHKGKILYTSQSYPTGYFFPVELCGEQPNQGEWDYLNLVQDNWERTIFVDKQLQYFWKTWPVNIDQLALIVWHGDQLCKLQKGLDSLKFSARLNLFGYTLANTDLSKTDNETIDTKSQLRRKLTWHSSEFPLPMEYAFTVYEDRISVQAGQLQDMIQILIGQRRPDPEAFIQNSLAQMIKRLHPLYIKLSRNNQVLEEQGDLRGKPDSLNHQGVSKEVYDYNFSDSVDEYQLHFQLSYPLSEPVQSFLRLCFLWLLPIINKASEPTGEKAGQEAFQRLKDLESRIDQAGKRFSVYTDRLYKDLANLSRKLGSEDKYSKELIHLLEQVADLRIFDIVFKEPEVSFDEEIDLVNLAIDIVYGEYDRMKQMNIFQHVLPPDSVSFPVVSNKWLIDKALRIIILQIFPKGKEGDLLGIIVEDNILKISSGRNLPLQKTSSEMELETLFIDKVMLKSGLNWEIKENEIALSKR